MDIAQYHYVMHVNIKFENTENQEQFAYLVTNHIVIVT